MKATNLYNKEAIEKITELAESIDFTMMATGLTKQPIHMIPMSTKKVDELGNIWFLSGKDSQHNANINADNAVQLSYAKPGDMEFMVVTGKAHIITEKTVLKNLYGSMDDMWFDGVDDPNLTAIKISPSEAQYWEPKHNKLVTIFKMASGAITGDQPDISNHGELKI